ncbi:MAG: glycosyltransferase family 2 protein [Acidobacteriota bacterium]
MISVVIPCHNAEAWLAETLASVAAQAVPLEVIVVDDGSTDRSASVAAQAAFPVRLIRQQQNGVSAARNTGTAAATGEYIQYLDADDVLEPQTLAARLARMHETGADVVLTPWIRWERQTTGQFESAGLVRPTLGARPDLDIFIGAWWPPGAILYRRDIVTRVGAWRLDLPVIQDARFLLDAALGGATFAHTEAAGLRYRVHGAGSLSTRDPRAFVEDCYRSAAELHDRWQTRGEIDDDRRYALVRVLGQIARSLFAIDRARFEDVLDRIHSLDARYRPERPPMLRALSGVIGYRSAEHVAFWWRHLKSAPAPRSSRLASPAAPRNTEPVS